MRVVRTATGLVGIGCMAIGLVYLLREDLGDLFDALIWLGGGVIVHDAFVAPATLILMVVATRFLPTWLRAPVAVGFVVLATVTIAAIPVLGRFGARPDNPTLLDRDYRAGWLIFAAIVVAGVVVAAARRRFLRVGTGEQS